MERFESQNLEKIECNREFIVKELNLISSDEKNPEGFLKLKSGEISNTDNAQRYEKTPLDNTEELASYFEGIKVEQPDKILRPKGDTTYFTTAGVQHVETILREEGNLESKKFIIAQPSIRSQFMDKVKEGTSTSFVNFSIESVRSNPQEFTDLFKNFINLICALGVHPDNLKFTIKEDSVKWGSRRFNNIGVTAYFDEVELEESIYIHDYPVSENEKISITDLGFGVERVMWATGQKSFYFSEFENIYKNYSTIDTDKITAVLDPIRTMVLIAGEGVIGSQHDHGYRLRQLSKRFVERGKGLNLKIEGLVHDSIEHWVQWGYIPTLNQEEIIEIIQLENERNSNSLFLKMLRETEHLDLSVNVNQSAEDFLKQMRFSVPQEIISRVIKKTT